MIRTQGSEFMDQPAQTPRPVTVRCPFCTTLNRVDLNRLSSGPKCANCGRPLRLDRPLTAAEEDFDQTIKTASVPVLVDFHADWCGPCKVSAPHVDAVAGEHAGELLVLKVDTDQNPGIAQRFKIRGIPAFLVFRNGQETRRHVGIADTKVLTTLVGL